MPQATELPPEFAEYSAVVAKVDAKFAAIATAHGAQMQCVLGCHGCCQPGLTVGFLQREAIRSWLSYHPDFVDQLRQLALEQPHGSSRCGMLDGAGACLIYPVRPLICRSHGAPVRVDGDLDVCPFNFRGQPLEGLPPGDSIDVQTVDTLLYVVSMRFAPKDRGQRFALTLHGLGVNPEADNRP